MRGWLLKRSIKKDRKSAKQKRLFILSESQLYYYRKEKELSAAGVIPLEYYAVSRRVLPQKKKFGLLLSLSVSCFPDLTQIYKLQAETEQQLEKWFEALQHRVSCCDNLVGLLKGDGSVSTSSLIKFLELPSSRWFLGKRAEAKLFQTLCRIALTFCSNMGWIRKASSVYPQASRISITSKSFTILERK